MKAELVLRRSVASACKLNFTGLYSDFFVFSKLYLVVEYGKFELFFGTTTGNAVWIISSPCNSKVFLYDYK